MRLGELLGEGLRGRWTLVDVQALTPPRLAALKANAERAGDKEVLYLVGRATYERSTAVRPRRPSRAGVKAGVKRPLSGWDEQHQAGRLIDQREKREARRVSAEAELSEVFHKIEWAVGSSIPDGDPIDQLIPWFKEVYGRDTDMMTVLDKATKKYRYKGYHDYLAQMWDSYAEASGTPKNGNPWR